jgi:hypothetical protein
MKRHQNHHHLGVSSVTKNPKEQILRKNGKHKDIIIKKTNDDIHDILSDVKKHSMIYFENMDNTFIAEVANKSPQGGNKWKVLTAILDKYPQHESI